MRPPVVGDYVMFDNFQSGVVWHAEYARSVMQTMTDETDCGQIILLGLTKNINGSTRIRSRTEHLGQHFTPHTIGFFQRNNYYEDV